MTKAATSSRVRSRVRAAHWWAMTAVLVLLGATCLGAGLAAHHHRLAGPTELRGRPATPATRGRTAPAAEPAPGVARSVPVSLHIPAIGVSVALSTLGLNPTGTVQVPTDPGQPGWFDLGPSPGQTGSSVILGHVDTYQGPAIFFHLPTLKAGEPVVVTLADGAVTTFRVDHVATYLKSEFPAQIVYGTHGSSALQLVTCGGTFDSTTGHYLSNVVVYTTLVGSTPATVPSAAA